MFTLYSGELAEVVRVAEEQREEVEKEEEENNQTQLTRECGMSFLWVVYTEITTHLPHTHSLYMHTNTPHMHTHTTHMHPHTPTHTTHAHTHYTHTRTTHAHTTHIHTHTTHTHSGHSTTNCVCGSHFLLHVHGHICPLPVPPHQLPRRKETQTETVSLPCTHMYI